MCFEDFSSSEKYAEELDIFDSPHGGRIKDVGVSSLVHPEVHNQLLFCFADIGEGPHCERVQLRSFRAFLVPACMQPW